MSPPPDTDTHYLLKQPHWFFVGGSIVAAVVALVAEGPGDFIGFGLLTICVISISSWSLIKKPSLHLTVAIVIGALVILGWTVKEPEPALFQSILITAAVGWRVERLSVSLLLLTVLALVPLAASLGPNESPWGWWNWSVGTVLTWCLGRVIRLLDQTLSELTEARSQLMDSAAREERLRVSRDVHDLVGHSLTAMLLNIRAAMRSMESNQEEARQALTDAERVGTTGMAEIRAALVDLRSDKALDIEGGDKLFRLPDGDAVLELLQQQTHITVDTSGDVERLKGPLAVAVYRILQECITNCSKHAQPGTAAISLTVHHDEIILTSGNALMNSGIISTEKSFRSMGLISMRERVKSLGGSFSAGLQDRHWQVNCRIPRHG